MLVGDAFLWRGAGASVVSVSNGFGASGSEDPPQYDCDASHFWAWARSNVRSSSVNASTVASTGTSDACSDEFWRSEKYWTNRFLTYSRFVASRPRPLRASSNFFWQASNWDARSATSLSRSLIALFNRDVASLDCAASEASAPSRRACAGRCDHEDAIDQMSSLSPMSTPRRRLALGDLHELAVLVAAGRELALELRDAPSQNLDLAIFLRENRPRQGRSLGVISFCPS